MLAVVDMCVLLLGTEYVLYYHGGTVMWDDDGSGTGRCYQQASGT